MRYLHTTLGFGLVMLAVVSSLEGCAPPIYFAKVTHGTVVDADTKQPIEGAVIVANWELYTRRGEGAHGLQSMQITEVVSGADGSYLVPGWGPRLRPCLTELDNGDPYLVVFKSGYEPWSFLNSYRRNNWIRECEWNGKAIELTPFRRPSEKRVDQLQTLLLWVGRGPALKALHDELMKERSSLEREVKGYRAKSVFVEAEGLDHERR
jgi:hypothetical protein